MADAWISGAGDTASPGSADARPCGEARRAVESVDREAQTKMLATLSRRFGDLELAEDALQEAFVQALNTWPKDGVPTSPAAWLLTVAKNKALDAIRHGAVQKRKLRQIASDEERALVPAEAVDPLDQVADDQKTDFLDDRLGLFFACAHPVLKPEDRVALTLRFLAGLTTEEVARGLLVPVPTMQQRMVRAKRRIRTLGVSFDLPNHHEVSQRLEDVQRVIYLLYTEGFARSSGDRHIRDDLTSEAIRLCRMLYDMVPGSAETKGLLGLLLLTESRRPSRMDDRGHPVPLAEQDRTRWSRDLLTEGIGLARVAATLPGAASYTIQATIAALHGEASSFEETDWEQISVLYRLLEVYEPGPVVRLGRAIAVGRAHGAEEGLRQLNRLADNPAMVAFRPYHIARAITLAELDDDAGAAAAYRRALELSGNAVEETTLREFLSELEGRLQGR